MILNKFLLLAFQAGLCTFSTYGFANGIKSADDSIMHWIAKGDSLLLIDPSRAMEFGHKALKGSIKSKNLAELVQSNRLLGTLYENRGEYALAIQYDLKSLQLAEQLKDPKLEGRALNNIGNVFLSQGKLEAALYYYKKALEKAIQSKDREEYAGSYNNIAIVYAYRQQFDLAAGYFNKVLDIRKELGDLEGTGAAYLNIASIHTYKKEPAKAIPFYQKALQIALQTGNRYDIANNYYNIGLNRFIEGSTTRAMANYLESRKIALQYEFNDLKWMTALGLLECAIRSGDKKQAAGYLELYSSSKDSLINIENGKQINELQVRYETEHKENQIRLLQKDKALQDARLAQGQLIIYSTFSGIIIILLGGTLLFRNYRQKQRVRQRLEASLAMIKGEEIERTRIAAELHDGIAASLSGVKLYMEALKPEFKHSSAKKAEVYTKANELLEQTCTELRQVAHNLMPGHVVKGGLVPALKKLQEQFNSLPELKFKLDIGQQGYPIPAEKEVMVYRIIQELISNTMTHSKADEIQLAILSGKGKLNITYTDNGRGYEIQNDHMGLGMKNLRSRVSYLGGKLDIQSSAGKGMKAKISIPVIEN